MTDSSAPSILSTILCAACHAQIEPHATVCSSCQGDPLIRGRFALQRVLGAGAAGTTYLALDRQTDQLVAIKELATRHLVAGSARMFGATLVFLELGFGVILAHKLTQVLPVLPQRLGQTTPMWWSEVLALAISALAFGVYFQAKPRHFGWVSLGSVLAYGGARLAGASLGAESGAFLGALLLGLGANTFARRTGQPASIVLIPGVILLVPGSVGLRSMTAIVLKDVMGGVQAGFAVMMIATAIVAGLLIADVASPARRSL